MKIENLKLAGAAGRSGPALPRELGCVAPVGRLRIHPT